MAKAKRKYLSMILLMCGMTASSIGVCQNTPGVFYSPVSEAIGVLRGTFALHITFCVLTISFLSLLLPRLIKTVPVKLIVSVGAVLMVVSTLFMSRASEMWQFYLLGIVRGAGAALCANVPVTIMINSWFHRRNGAVTSIVLSFSGLAGAVCSPILASCISSRGWQSAYLLQAGMLVFFMLPAVLIPFRPTPEAEGLLPYGYEADRASSETASSETGSFRFLSLPFVCFAVMGTLHVTLTSISQHISGFAVSLGMSADFGALMLSFIMMGNIGMKLVIGLLSDRIGPLRSTVVMIFTNVVGILAILTGSRIGSGPVMLLGAFLFGSIYAVGAVGLALLTKHFFGPEHYGTVFPVLNLVHSLGASASLSLIGYIYDFTGSYIPAFFIALSFHAVDLLLLAAAAAAIRRQKAAA